MSDQIFENAEEEMKYLALQFEREHEDAKYAYFLAFVKADGKTMVWTGDGWKYLKDDNQ